MSLFKLRGELDKSQSLVLGIIGFVFLIVVWWIMAEAFSIQKPVIQGFETRLPSSIFPDSTNQIDLDSLAHADSVQFANATEFTKVYPLLPTPLKVVQSYPDLIQNDALFSNTTRSIWLNLQGYFWAAIISISIGFVIGLYPLFRGLFKKQVDALRYLPLTALTGMFIIWFGIEDQMKIAFLAFGIIVYLLPVVVQRIDEVNDVYLKTVFTLGAKDWDTIKSVYIPSVMSRLVDDIRVLTAISWTYIIIAELLNRQGGIGSLIYIKARQGQTEKVFAILIVIIIIGFLQDRIFAFIDKRIFPHKYSKNLSMSGNESQYGILMILGSVVLLLILASILPAFASTLNMIFGLIVIASLLLIVYGEIRLYNAKSKHA